MLNRLRKLHKKAEPKPRLNLAFLIFQIPLISTVLAYSNCAIFKLCGSGTFALAHY